MAPWSAPRRVAFRWLFVYVLLYLAPFPLDALPFGIGERVGKASRVPWYSIVPWVSTHVLHFAKPVALSHHGLGDNTFGWVWCFSQGVLALIIALGWSLGDRSSKAYPQLADWMRVYIRYYVAWMLISYGTYKVFNTQFPPLRPDMLMRAYGDSSASTLLWMFMGYSPAYTVFGGLAECLGGVLLFWRRTTLLGALISFAVITNVMMLNFCYDVPLKLFSMHLLAMTVVIAAPDAKRCLDFFLLNRPTRPSPRLHLQRWAAHARVLKPIVVLVLAGGDVVEAWREWREVRSLPQQWYYGLYEVETFAREGVVAPPLRTDSSQWQRVAFRNGGGAVERMDRHVETFSLQHDDESKTLTLQLPQRDVVLSYVRRDDGHLILDGRVNGDTVHVVLRQTPLGKMLLFKHPFRWVIDAWAAFGDPSD